MIELIGLYSGSERSANLPFMYKPGSIKGKKGERDCSVDSTKNVYPNKNEVVLFNLGIKVINLGFKMIV